MPPIVKQRYTPYSKDLPDILKPFIFHGVHVQYEKGQDECLGECPFCGRVKFSLNAETGQWRCFVCGGGQEKGGGGLYDFLEKLFEDSDKATQSEDYVTLAKDRGLEFPDTLVHWGVCKSALSGEWLIPGYGLDHQNKLRLQQLYLYTYSKVEKRMVVMATPTCKHTLIGLQHYDTGKPDVWVWEGPWDGIRAWEIMRSVKPGADGNFIPTASQDSCLLAGANVLSVPGCTTFADHWIRWFSGKAVKLGYDNDYPKENPKTGKVNPPAGTNGMRAATAKLANTAGSIHFLNWGPEGYDPDLPDGYDARDAMTNGITGFTMLVNRMQPVPDNWLEESVSVTSSGQVLQCKPCTQWKSLVSVWRKALKWTDGLEHGLASGLAVIASTGMLGDQLWMKIIGPASCGKSTLAEAYSINKDYTKAKSTLRGFHSGWRGPDGAAVEGSSLIDDLRGKTFITKDGDTLLQSPNLAQILSEARDLFDGTSRSSYRTGAGRDHEGIRTTWLLYGTASLRKLDSSELGERFLDCVIMHSIDEELEDEILWRVAHKSAAAVDIEHNEDDGVQYSPELTAAMELTGGYVSWLREKGPKILPTIGFSDDAKRVCVNIGKFVAYMRARPSKAQAEKAERELAARLVSQHIRYAKCLALVLNRKEVDELVLSRVVRIGLDTARGIVLNVTKQLFDSGGQGVEFRGIHIQTEMTETDLRALLRFLKAIGVVERFDTSARKAWRTTATMYNLYQKVMASNG